MQYTDQMGFTHQMLRGNLRGFINGDALLIFVNGQ